MLMLLNKPVYDLFGHSYCFMHGRAPDNHSLCFSDVTSARRFLSQLDCTPAHLDSLSASISSVPYSGPETCIDRLAHMLCHGTMRVIKASPLKTKERASFKSANGRASVSILPADLTSAAPPGVSKGFSSADKARTYLNSLEMTDIQAKSLVEQLNLPAPANTPPKEVLVNGLAAGVLRVHEAVGRNGSAKTSPEPQSAHNTAGNRRADKVAPPASPAPASAAAPNMQAAANDQEDQARALVEASENGSAFCEECQKRQASV